MKVTLNWLKQYVDFDWPPEELAERLTMIGIEVESVQKVAGEFDGVVVAQILASEKHPNADRLSVCRVTDGKAERQIVCGAKNYKVGDKVPLALPGCTLPTPAGSPPFTIKASKMRAVESQGMLCSSSELGLSADADGLLILPPDAKVGQPFAEHLGRASGDVVYDLEITPNRPDLNSVIGIAREISAVTGNALKMPDVGRASVPASPNLKDSTARKDARPPASDLVSVRIEDAELCPRYTARVIRGVKIGPSPDWLRSTLEKVGIRSISNVVDVTNFVMLETGQPLHAFDYHLIAKGKDGKPTIVIRRANEKEKFKTLDDQERTLTDQMLLIADEQKGIALAGIMGGQNTEIRNDTRDVLIESAYFSPVNIRRTSKGLGLRSESSYRFERGADVGISDWASQRAAQLILETAGGQPADGVVDAYPKPAEPKTISLRPEKIKQLLGVEIKRDDVEAMLASLGLKTASRVPVPVDAPVEVQSPLKFRIPTFRVDLKREIDLIEEVARLYGVDKIPSTPPRGATGSNPFDAVHDEIAEARRILSGLGLHEAQGQTLVSKSEVRSAKDDGTVVLANPLSSDMDVLRPSLLPALIHALRHNLSRKNNDVALFEIGRVFSQGRDVALRRPDGPAGRPHQRDVREESRIAIALTGQRNPLFWSGEERDAKFDIHDLKGLLEEFLEQFGARGISYTRRSESTSLFLESATIHLGKQQIGELGLMLPPLVKRYDLRDAVLLAELNLDLLLARRSTAKSFKPLPAFPTIRRDVAMLVPETTTHEAVLQLVKQTKPANLESIELFDIFRGKNVPQGQKSMAYAFTYRNAERTLTDAEVNAAHTKVVEALKTQLKASVREA